MWRLASVIRSLRCPSPCGHSPSASCWWTFSKPLWTESEGACLSPFTEHGWDMAQLFSTITRSLLSTPSSSPSWFQTPKVSPPLFVLFPLSGWFCLWTSFSSLPRTHFVAQVGLKLFCFQLLIVGMSDLNDHSWSRKTIVFVCIFVLLWFAFFFLELLPPHCHSHLCVILRWLWKC